VGEKFKMKNIVLGVTGSIATYKAADLVRLLVKADFKVKVVMTENAKQFVHANTFSALSGHRVYDNLFDPEINPMMHIELARWADAVLIAPASASILGKLAAGIADDLLTTVCLATRANMIVAPAMNKEMWANAIVEDNVKKLQEQYHYEILFPEIGEQACGDFGAGRLIENEKIVAFLENKNSGILKGLKVLITAGPTQEAIDPVRYISNHSSGKMGYALAEAAQRFGAKVTLISGPTALTSPAVNQFLPVITAEGMNTAVMENVKNCDIFISTAAVADYKPKEVAKNKIKKSEAAFTLSLEKTIDILSAVSALPKKPFIVGFAAETENLIENATQKLKKKNLDMIIANLITPAGAPFNADENEVILLEKDKTPEHLPRTEKSKLAQKILEKIALSLGVKS
jgi:phosphopantothenoylcysteine decarboxylase/phosphopantothenate--cysteine ligase